MDLILANGKIVTAHESYDADIGIENGVIKQIGHGLGPAGRTVDCSGKILFPGGVDVHTHVEFELMGQETADDFHSSTVAAACGGITTICDYAFPEPGTVAAGLPGPLEPAGREVGHRLRPAPDHLPARRAHPQPDAGLRRRRLHQLQDLHDRLRRVRQVCGRVPALHGGGRQARRDGQHPLRGPVLHLLHDPEARGGEQLQRPHLPGFQAAHLGGARRPPRALDGPRGRRARPTSSTSRARRGWMR